MTDRIVVRPGMTAKIKDALGYECAPSMALVILNEKQTHPELRAELETFLFSGVVACHCGYQWKASSDHPTDERCPMCLAARCRVCSRMDV